MPVGPDDNGADTIESIFAYCTGSVVILAVDDSKDTQTKSFLESVDPRVIRLASAGYSGIRGALFCSLAGAYTYALEHYRFDVLLRIDTDALITGPQPEADALAAFAADPSIGMLGSYRYGYDGAPRDFHIVAQGMFRETSLLGIANPARRQRLNAWIRSARKYGYERGEHCLGAAIYLRPEAVYAMQAAGDLQVREFHDSVISEDHLFSLLTIRHGFTLADFVTGDLPMGIQWRGLPDSPENLLKRGKKIVHSVKFYKNLSQADIRAYFKKRRPKAH
jgi:hypothetical protein